MLLTKSDFFNAPRIIIEKVNLPELGGHVFVRSLLAEERDAYEASRLKFGKGGAVEVSSDNARGRLACLVLCDEKGTRLFGDDDAGELGRHQAAVIERICDAARRLSGMNAEADEVAEKN